MINDPAQITRVILGNVPPWLAIAFYATVATAVAWATYKFVMKFLRYRQGRARTESGEPFPRLSWLARIVSVGRLLIFHRELLRDRFAGIAHILVFYGFVILFWGTCMVFLEHDTPLHFFYGSFYQVASLIIDVGGLAFLVGLAMFLYRRAIGKTSRIVRRADVLIFTWLLVAIGVTGFLLEGARIAVDRPAFERWSVVGYALADGLSASGFSGDAALRLHRFLWGGHAILCVTLFAMLPWQFFSHLVFGPVAWGLKTNRLRSTLRASLDGTAATAQGPGAVNWRQLPWIDLLQADACTTCGRCNAVCPAHAADKPLRPRDIVLGIRDAMDRDDSSFARIEPQALWSCTTCGACNEACPVGIEVYDKIVEMRRGKVESGDIPGTAARRLDSVIENYNPFERPNAARLDWAAGLEVPVAEEGESIELLYWVGCAGSFDPDGQRVSRAMIKILNHLRINYRVLGKRECCTGDPARRLGEEGLFVELAQSNLATLARHGVARVITHCPHCFNSFRNEYPQLAEIAFEVEHHSQFLARMIRDGKLDVAGDLPRTVTFHDPCYLGRGNGETEAPRQILAALSGIRTIEMPRHGRDSFCCGAGGGSLWLDVKGSDRIENQRTREAADTGAEWVVTGCPFCKTMLEAGRQSFDNNIVETVDLAELVAQAVELQARRAMR